MFFVCLFVCLFTLGMSTVGDTLVVTSYYKVKLMTPFMRHDTEYYETLVLQQAFSQKCII